MLRSVARYSLVVTVALSAAACGSSGSSGTSGGAQPAPGVSGFVSGRFNTLPTLPRMRALGPEQRNAGVTTRSYEITGSTPHDAVLAYAQLLSGWHNRVRPHAVAREFRGSWLSSDGSTLQVTAIDASTLNTSGSTAVQMTLQLYSPSTPASTTPSKT